MDDNGEEAAIRVALVDDRSLHIKLNDNRYKDKLKVLEDETKVEKMTRQKKKKR